MPDEQRERICSYCGRANHLGAVRCINCGQRTTGPGAVLLTQEAPAPWWSGSVEAENHAIPPPPQVREEAARAETRRREAERLEAERLEWERKAEKRAQEARRQAAAERAATVTAKTKSEICSKCGTPRNEAAGFSFCQACGAGFPLASEQKARQKAMGNVTTAVRSAPQSHTSPALMAFFSFICPGVGQFFNAQFAKGGLLLLALWVVLSIFHFSSFGVLLLIARLVAAIDAYRIADRRRRGETVRHDEWDLG